MLFELDGFNHVIHIHVIRGLINNSDVVFNVLSLLGRQELTQGLDLIYCEKTLESLVDLRGLQDFTLVGLEVQT